MLRRLDEPRHTPHGPADHALQTFCSLVETLLESHLADIGVSPEDFYEICMKAKQPSAEGGTAASNHIIVEQILAVEDFLSA